METGNLINIIKEFAKAFTGIFNDRLIAVIAVLSLIVSVWSLFSNKKGLIKQIRLSIFSDSIHSVLQDKDFQESQEYVLSGEIVKVIERVRDISKKGETKKIGLQDFKEIIRKAAPRTTDEKKDIIIPEKVISFPPTSTSIPDEVIIRKSYNKVVYFCSRMEYLGVISSEEQRRSLVIGYYGQTIRESYPKLYPLIEATREDAMKKKMFKHYSKMYYRISIPFPVITKTESPLGKPQVNLSFPNEIKKHKTKKIKIYYTTDGSEPTSDSILYNETPIPLEKGTTTVKALSIKGKKGDRRSPIVTKTFNVPMAALEIKTNNG